MKTSLVFFISVLLFFSCTSGLEKGEAVLIKDLEKATTLLAERNFKLFKKVEKRYRADTTSPELKMLYGQFSMLLQYKDTYKNALLPEGADLQLQSTEFKKKCFSLLTEKEIQLLGESLRETLLMKPELLEEMDRTALLPYELRMEAEMVLSEVFLLLLKDASAAKPGFDWQYYWE